MQITEIRVDKRHRRDMGDIRALAASIRELGLLQPIAVQPNGLLVAGERRLEAAKLLGWTEIPVNVVRDLDDAARLLKAERDENTQRLPFAPSEMIALGADLEAIERPAARERQEESRANRGENFTPRSEPGKGKSLDKVASALGVSRPTYVKAKEVVEAAEREPERFKALVEEMDRTKRVDGVYRKLQTQQREEQKAARVVEAKASPTLYTAPAEALPIASESIDVIITSPPYNLGADEWPMGGDGRTPREDGIGYGDAMPEAEYQAWQVRVFRELWRVSKPGASFFYNHKVRQQKGRLIHPMDWIRHPDNHWIARQEIIWDRGSTHNHSPSLFWPEDERIYWLTKGAPTIPEGGIGMSTVWDFFGPVPNTWHPAPFCEELPKRCLQAIGRPGIVVLDPFGGSMTTCKVALGMGYEAIGVDINAEYIERARKENGWTTTSES